jgi:hypothetical protein
MNLHRDWRTILRRAWSVRLMLLSAVLGGVSASLSMVQPYINANPLVIAFAVGVATTGSALAAIWARVTRQKNFDAD